MHAIRLIALQEEERVCHLSIGDYRMIFIHLLEVSYNRPKFSPCATWSSNAITFADSNVMIQAASDVFITTNNTVYATSFLLDSVLVWTEGSPSTTRRLFGNLSYSHRIFVTNDGDVYADDTHVHSRVQKWTMNATMSTIFMSSSGLCGGLFVDIYDNLYCSQSSYHKVLQISVNRGINSAVIVAGNGTVGSAPNMLNRPYGIFVDIDLSLYVADFDNNRVQLVRSGRLNGTTVAGNGAPDTIALNQPIAVILDGDGYLFIVDCVHHRIMGSGPNGFRCVVGCTGISGTTVNQLSYPRGLSFDSYGNLYVADTENSRIQKFMLAKNSCGEPSDTLSSF